MLSTFSGEAWVVFGCRTGFFYSWRATFPMPSPFTALGSNHWNPFLTSTLGWTVPLVKDAGKLLSSFSSLLCDSSLRGRAQVFPVFTPPIFMRSLSVPLTAPFKVFFPFYSRFMTLVRHPQFFLSLPSDLPSPKPPPCCSQFLQSFAPVTLLLFLSRPPLFSFRP